MLLLRSPQLALALTSDSRKIMELNFINLAPDKHQSCGLDRGCSLGCSSLDTGSVN